MSAWSQKEMPKRKVRNDKRGQQPPAPSQPSLSWGAEAFWTPEHPAELTSVPFSSIPWIHPHHHLSQKICLFNNLEFFMMSDFYTRKASDQFLFQIKLCSAASEGGEWPAEKWAGVPESLQLLQGLIQAMLAEEWGRCGSSPWQWSCSIKATITFKSEGINYNRNMNKPFSEHLPSFSFLPAFSFSFLPSNVPLLVFLVLSPW